MQPSFGTLKHGGRQNQAVRDHDQRIELQAAQNLERFRRLETRRLVHAEAQLERAAFSPGLACNDWPRPAGRSGWVNTAQIRCACASALERRNGELRRAGEPQP